MEFNPEDQTIWLGCSKCGRNTIHAVRQIGSFVVKLCLFCNDDALLMECQHETLKQYVYRDAGLVLPERGGDPTISAPRP